MRASDVSSASWRKSSHSTGGDDQADCVEIAELPDWVAMRDSKDPAGPVLAFAHAKWRTFVGSIQAGKFD